MKSYLLLLIISINLLSSNLSLKIQRNKHHLKRKYVERPNPTEFLKEWIDRLKKPEDENNSPDKDPFQAHVDIFCRKKFEDMSYAQRVTEKIKFNKKDFLLLTDLVDTFGQTWTTKIQGIDNHQEIPKNLKENIKQCIYNERLYLLDYAFKNAFAKIDEKTNEKISVTMFNNETKSFFIDPDGTKTKPHFNAKNSKSYYLNPFAYHTTIGFKQGAKDFKGKIVINNLGSTNYDSDLDFSVQYEIEKDSLGENTHNKMLDEAGFGEKTMPQTIASFQGVFLFKKRVEHYFNDTFGKDMTKLLDTNIYLKEDILSAMKAYIEFRDQKGTKEQLSYKKYLEAVKFTLLNQILAQLTDNFKPINEKDTSMKGKTIRALTQRLADSDLNLYIQKLFNYKKGEAYYAFNADKIKEDKNKKEFVYTNLGPTEDINQKGEGKPIKNKEIFENSIVDIFTFDEKNYGRIFTSILVMDLFSDEAFYGFESVVHMLYTQQRKTEIGLIYDHIEKRSKGENPNAPFEFIKTKQRNLCYLAGLSEKEKAQLDIVANMRSTSINNILLINAFYVVENYLMIPIDKNNVNKRRKNLGKYFSRMFLAYELYERRGLNETKYNPGKGKVEEEIERLKDVMHTFKEKYLNLDGKLFLNLDDLKEAAIKFSKERQGEKDEYTEFMKPIYEYLQNGYEDKVKQQK